VVWLYRHPAPGSFLQTPHVPSPHDDGSVNAPDIPFPGWQDLAIRASKCPEVVIQSTTESRHTFTLIPDPELLATWT
jgi:hypothetical protein